MYLQSGGEHFSDGSDSEESIGPETFQSGLSMPPQVQDDVVTSCLCVVN